MHARTHARMSHARTSRARMRIPPRARAWGGRATAAPCIETVDDIDIIYTTTQHRRSTARMSRADREVDGPGFPPVGRGRVGVREHLPAGRRRGVRPLRNAHCVLDACVA